MIITFLNNTRDFCFVLLNILARFLACPKFSSRPARFRVQLHVQDSGGREIWQEEPGDRRMERNDGGAVGSGNENMHANTGKYTHTHTHTHIHTLI